MGEVALFTGARKIEMNKMSERFKNISTSKLKKLRKCSLCRSEMILMQIDAELKERKNK